MADQTPLQVIAGALSSPYPGNYPTPLVSAELAVKRLDAAGFAIVKRPTGDQVTAALKAFDEKPSPTPRYFKMLAALAAAEAVKDA